MHTFWLMWALNENMQLASAERHGSFPTVSLHTQTSREFSEWPEFAPSLILTSGLMKHLREGWGGKTAKTATTNYCFLLSVVVEWYLVYCHLLPAASCTAK